MLRGLNPSFPADSFGASVAKVTVTPIGANGAGKSTTLNTVAGLIRPDSGSIEFKGQSIVGVSPTGSWSAAWRCAPRGAVSSRG